MIPSRLLLRNFLSYKALTEIDFAGIHVACLSGDNGHGKSALLDAITWALWGKSRVTSDDDLVHLGETEMEVELEFVLGHDRYRVLRKRRRGGGGRRGDTALELQAEASEGWRSISGNSVRATQQRIVDLLRLDYDTFINSAFLVQGRADEFTTRTPVERKRVLGEILGLRFYDILVDRAKDEVRRRDTLRTELQTEIDFIDRQTATLPQLRAEAEAVRAELREAEAELRRVTAELDALRETKRLADERRRQLMAAVERVQEAERELRQATEAIDQHERAITRYEETLARADEIEQGYSALEAARRDEAEYGRKAGEALDLQQRRHELELTIDSARHAVRRAVDDAEREIDELEAKAAALGSLEAQRADAERLAAEAGALAEQLRARREEARSARDEAHGLSVTNAALRQAIDALKSKFDQLAGADAACPLCARPLGIAEKDRITTMYREEGLANQRTFTSNKQRLVALQAEADALASEADRVDAERAERERHAAASLARIDRDLAEARNAAAALDGARERHAAVVGRLDRGDYAVDERNGLIAVTFALDRLDYDAGRHEALRSNVGRYAEFESQHATLAEARALHARDSEALDRARADVDGWRRRRDRACAEVEELRATEGGAADLDQRLADVETAQRGADDRVGRLRKALGSVEGNVETASILVAQRVPKAQQLRDVVEERQLYEELVAAFGKRGVQALLIDEALPELTDEANRLLHRMTAGRMSLHMTTQRATQKGALTETLDIHIADELGTRAYETYSGGEAFRIDFALRIALSKLLARRAGAPLPILVVDEGFGTQDASGRERLVEAITAVQDDFRMLLAITHIDELRDVFPHRIHVAKTAAGSVVEVI